MSIKVMTAVWPLRLVAFDKLVLLALADIADDEGRCFPAMSKLTEKCGMSDRTIQRSLNRLQADGLVRRERREGRSTIYHVDASPPSNSHPRPIVTPDSLSFTPDSLSPPEKKKTSSLKPSLNRQPARVGERDEPPPSNLNVEAWHRWVEYRKTIRRPIKPPSVAAAQRKLAGFGADQAAVVEQSIANGWQGVFPLKLQGPQRAKASSEWT